MNMVQKKTILVTSATGAQGGSVARALLNNPSFAVKALTRNATSPKALALQDAGAEIITGDLSDINSLLLAMKGCYGVFGVTNFWEHYTNEYQQGKNLVDAVKESGIQHFVFSTLANYHELSAGQLSVPHCDLKASLQTYCKQLGIPASFVQISFYYENFLTFFPFQKETNGHYYFGFPQGNTPLASISVEDYGGIVNTVFDHPADYIERTVRAVGADYTCDEYAAIFTEVLQQPVHYRYIPRDKYAAFDFPGAEELANMFEVQRLYITDHLADKIESYGLNPAIQPFRNWVEKNKAAFMSNIQQGITLPA